MQACWVAGMVKDWEKKRASRRGRNPKTESVNKNHTSQRYRPLKVLTLSVEESPKVLGKWVVSIWSGQVKPSRTNFIERGQGVEVGGDGCIHREERESCKSRHNGRWLDRSGCDRMPAYRSSAMVFFLAEMRGRLGKKIHTKKYGTQTQSLVRFDNLLRCIRCKTSQASLQL